MGMYFYITRLQKTIFAKIGMLSVEIRRFSVWLSMFSWMLVRHARGMRTVCVSMIFATTKFCTHFRCMLHMPWSRKIVAYTIKRRQDLRQALEAAVRSQNCRAAFVLSGIGSLSDAGFRFAGTDQPQRLTGDTEVLSLPGTVAVNLTASGAHSTHMALSTATGEVLGGHVAPGLHRARHRRSAAGAAAGVGVCARARCVEGV